ncbi:MAG: sulfatase-like hydrolase/transferase [Opitutaceae bacterium]
MLTSLPKIVSVFTLSVASVHAQVSIIDASFNDTDDGILESFSSLNNGIGSPNWNNATGEASMLIDDGSSSGTTGCVSDASFDGAAYDLYTLAFEIDSIVDANNGPTHNGHWIGLSGNNSELWNNADLAGGTDGWAVGIRFLSGGVTFVYDALDNNEFTIGTLGSYTAASLQDGYTAQIDLNATGWTVSLTSVDSSTGGSGTWPAGFDFSTIAADSTVFAAMTYQQGNEADTVVDMAAISVSSETLPEQTILPTDIVVTDAQSTAVVGATNVNSGDTSGSSDIYIRERRSESQGDRRISSFLNFDVSQLSTTDISTPGFSVTFTADYDYRLNDLNSTSAVLGTVTNGAWDTTTALPLHSWGRDDSINRQTLIDDISTDTPPSTITADITNIVSGWVDGTIDNYGLVLFVGDLESNAAGFSNPRLILTSPLDSDNDDMPDNYELANELNPNDASDRDISSDEDSLTNFEEFTLGTDPQNPDSDNDGLDDDDEVNGSLNPWVSGIQSVPPGDPTDPLNADSDNDGVDDHAEILAGTDPNLPPPDTGPIIPFLDSDGDSFRDEAEVAFGSDPNDTTDIPDHRSAIDKPNVVIIYADDLGFGDISAYGDLFGTISSAPTPNIDTLADEGVLFTQGHSGNGVCTPSRYALLTAKYNWREFNDITGNYGGTIGGDELPRVADVTIAEFLKTQAYDTAAIGKWHLGGAFYLRDGSRITGGPTDPSTVDWERRVDLHATDHGFDEFRGYAVAINFAPYVYMIDDSLQFWDTTLNSGAGGFRDATNDDPFRFFTKSELNAPVIGAKGSRDGLGDPSYSQLDAGPQLVSDAEAYFADRATRGDTDPFFVYLPLHSPHRPWAVTPEFRGDDTARGFIFADWMREVDDRVGRILAAIEDNGYGSNTMVVFTSDNGPERDMLQESLEFGSDSNGPLRGAKRETYEGGTRVPFMVRWPGQAAAGMKVTDPIWQGDIFATIAAYLGAELPNSTAPDGESFLNLVRGQEKPYPRREGIILCAQRGDLAFKTIDGWKLIDATGGSATPSWDSFNNQLEGADVEGINRGTPKQLFNQSIDLGENYNLIADITDEVDIRAEVTAVTGRDLLGTLDTLRTSFSTEVYPRIPDNDGDSIPNSYEIANGLDPDWPSDADADSDGDGVSNFAEYLAGTDLADSTDIFKINPYTLQEDSALVTCPSALGRTYEVVWSNNLVNWFPIISREGTGSDITFDIDLQEIDLLDEIEGNLDPFYIRVEVSLAE